MANFPKDAQPAFQRWELKSFGDDRPSAVARRPAAAAPVEPVMLLPSDEELAAIREQARAAGHEEG
ncbi:MAG TPA: flagellar assembly protein FliH, partial [Pseudoduganella sp.]